MPIAPTSREGDGVSSLERFLLGSSQRLPDAELLDEAGLEGYAASLPNADPAPRLHSARLAATARHAAIRREVAGLLDRWHRAGIGALIFKGFHLAEYVYPKPAMRRYSDVDMLIRSVQAARAAEVARECGWLELWRGGRESALRSNRNPAYSGHEILQLRHGRVGVQLDVHRRLVHNNHNRLARFGAQERITRLAWAAAEDTELQGVPVRQLSPVDAVLVGLVLNRCWSPEDWQLRPHDFLDFRFLVERHALSLARLSERAEELGCRRTLDIFLQRCDPFSGRCLLDPPSRLERHRWNLSVAPERGNRYLQRSTLALRDLLSAPLEVLRELAPVVRTLLVARRCRSTAEAARLLELPVSRPRALDAGRWRSMRRGVHWALKLMPARSGSRMELEALGLLCALRTRSVPARLRREGVGSPDERLYLELEGERLALAGTRLS